METINKKIITTVALSAVIVVGMFWFVFFFQIPKVKEMSEAIQKEKLDYFVRQEKNENIQRLKKDLLDIESQKKEMEDVFFKKNESVAFFRVLEKAAEESGCQIRISVADMSKVKFTQSKPDKKMSADEEDALPKNKSVENNSKIQAEEAAKTDEMSKINSFPAFNLELTGSFASIMDYLVKMENVSYFVRALMLDMTPIKTGNYVAAAGNSATGGQSAQNNVSKDEKGVKMNLLIIVYSDDKK